MKDTANLAALIAAAVKAHAALSQYIEPAAGCATSAIDDGELRTLAYTGAAASRAAAAALRPAEFDELAFNLERAADIADGIAALTLGALERLDGRYILKKDWARDIMLGKLADVAADLVESSLRQVEGWGEDVEAAELITAVRANLNS